MKKPDEHCDYNIRQWALDSAIALNKKGASASKVLIDAREFYKFTRAVEGTVKLIKEDK